MRCLVTGAAGFIGSSLIDRLLGDGHEVIGVDCFVDYYPRESKMQNLASALEHPSFSFHEADLTKIDLVELLGGVNWVFHQAAQAGVRASWGEDFEIYINSNIRATQQLLEAAKSDSVRESLQKIVYASSSSVYGNAETLPTSEQTKPQPVSPYGVTKLAAEHLMVLYTKAYQVPTVSLRYFTVYGPRQRPDMAFHRFIRAGLTGGEIDIYGDGTQTRDFTFIDDIIDANIAAAESKSEELVYNIGGGSRVSVNEVLSIIKEVLNKDLQINYQGRQLGDARHTGADISLAATELEYRPKVALQEGLAREADWLGAIL